MKTDIVPAWTGLETKINYIQRIAREKYDGHFTLYSFTTGYSGFFGTSLRGDFNYTIFSTLGACLENMIINQPNIYQFAEEEMEKEEV